MRYKLGIPQKWEKERLLGREYIVRKGTIHAEPDYDDAWLLALGAHSTTAIDVGSNIGQAAFVLLYPNTIQQLILIEPNPKALALASENLIHNHLVHRVRLVCAFASERPGEIIPFWTIGSGSAGSMYMTHAATASRLNLSYEVPTTTLDSICEIFHILPDLVKIDTEGAEYLVLQGSRFLANHRKTRFLVEMHSTIDNPMEMNAQNVLTWCQTNQYSAWYLAGKVELTSSQQIAQRGRCHLLLQPVDWEFPEWLRKIDQGSPLKLGI